MTDKRIVVIGASAGGVEALTQIIRSLPADFAAPLCVVLHIPPESPSLLSTILGRQKTLKVKDGENGDVLRPGIVYVAPPDHHLVVGKDYTLRASRGPKENRHRPAIDPLFRSAAVAYGTGAIGVVLTGNLDDGTAGLMAIKQQGGTIIVQDPQDAMYPDMPRNALEHTKAAHCVPLSGIPALLVEVLNEPPKEAEPVGAKADQLDMEARMAELDPEALQVDERPGTPSPWSCPDCGGVMWEIQEDQDYVRFRCRVGHAYSPESMLGAHSLQLEEALWTAMKTLEESARLARRLADSERRRGHEWMARRFDEREEEARSRVEVIRRFISQDLAKPISHVRTAAAD
ncbi:MAG TPA: chemotaxis protein CheB [Thermoanaerobaculia bacterium]